MFWKVFNRYLYRNKIFLIAENDFVVTCYQIININLTKKSLQGNTIWFGFKMASVYLRRINLVTQNKLYFC